MGLALNLATYTLIWLFFLIAAGKFVFEVVGIRYMVMMFPEGWRWWQLPLQLFALTVFGIVVLFHPFGGLPW